MTSKQVTSPPWNSRRLVHGKEVVWASLWSVALHTFYGQIFLCLLYSSFSLLKLPSRLTRELLVCDAADRSQILVFSKKLRFARLRHIPRVHFPCVFSSNMCLGFTSHCQFPCDAAHRSLLPKIYPRKTRFAGGNPRRHCGCKFSVAPTPGKRPNVDKGALYVKAMLGYSTFKCSQNAGRSCKERRLGHVTHDSSDSKCKSWAKKVYGVKGVLARRLR